MSDVDEALLIERARHFVTAFGCEIADMRVNTALLAHAMWVLAREAEIKRDQLLTSDTGSEDAVVQHE